MRSDLVVVRDCAGKAKICVVCSISDGVVAVTSPAAFERLKAGGSDVFPIGFRAKNVFVYDGKKISEPVRRERLKKWEE